MNPEKLPLGYAYSAKAHADETHNLPLPPDALGSTDFEAMVGQLIDLIKGPAALQYSDQYVVFARDDEMEVVQNILMQLLKCTTLDSSAFKLLPLNTFFHRFLNGLEMAFGSVPRVPITEATVKLIFQKDQYEYCEGCACEWHDKLNCKPFCALGKTMRLAFMFLHEVLDLVGIKERISGRHIPEGYSYQKMPEKKVEKTENESSECDDTSTQYKSSAELDLRPLVLFDELSEFSDLTISSDPKAQEVKNVFAWKKASEVSKSPVFDQPKKVAEVSKPPQFNQSKNSSEVSKPPQFDQPKKATELSKSPVINQPKKVTELNKSSDEPKENEVSSSDLDTTNPFSDWGEKDDEASKSFNSSGCLFGRLPNQRGRFFKKH